MKGLSNKSLAAIALVVMGALLGLGLLVFRRKPIERAIEELTAPSGSTKDENEGHHFEHPGIIHRVDGSITTSVVSWAELSDRVNKPKPDEPSDPSTEPGDGDKPQDENLPPTEPEAELLPRPERLSQPANAPSIGTAFLDDEVFIEAVHAAGSATRGEPDAPGAPEDGHRPPLIVGIGDRGFMPMLLNFIATSIERFSLRHYLVVALEEGMCADVPVVGGAVTCVTWNLAGTIKKGDYGSPEFAKLVNIKSEAVLAITQLGYDTLLVDGDIVFLTSPLPVLSAKYAEFDLQIQDDAEAKLNSGFMYVKASQGGLTFIAEAVEVARKNPKIRQQPAVNKAIESAAGRFRVHVLPMSQFPCGKAYYESPRRMFAWEHPCHDCVILHNNWIVGTAAKVFRFKESLQWLVDTDGYYSSPTARYIQLDNPSRSVSQADEAAALGAALAIGRMLGRTVILPEFACRKCVVTGLGGTAEGCSGQKGDRDSCMITASYSIEAFTAAVGQESYREHMFRYNPLTPAQSDDGSSPVHLSFAVGPGSKEADMEQAPETAHVIAASGTPSDAGAGSGDAVVHEPASSGSPTEVEVLEWFGEDSSPVLRFAHLYKVNPRFTEQSAQADFDSMWSKALVKSTIRQYKS